MKMKIIVLSLLGLLLSGCTGVLVPYEQEAACRANEYGRCVNPDEAHSISVSGEPAGPVITQKGLLTEEEYARRYPEAAAREAALGAGALPKSNDPEQFGYLGYQAEVYNQLRGLLEQPATPLVVQAKTVRTLILPYAPGGAGGNRLYMPRYVYWRLGEGSWVLGDYLVETREYGDSFLQHINADGEVE